MERVASKPHRRATSGAQVEPRAIDLSATTAVILAGGLGTRLRDVLPERAKVLAEVDGRPFVCHLLAQLASAGVKHVVLSIGHRGEQVRQVVGTSYGGLAIEYAHEPSPLGTGGAIRRALPLVRSHALFVLNGDSYCDVDLAGLWLWHHQHAAHGTLTLTHVGDARRYGTVDTDRSGRVRRFVEKSRRRRAGTVNAGLYLLRRSLVASIRPGVACSLEHELLPRWLASGIYGYTRGSRFIDIGTPESLAAAAGFFRFATERRATTRPGRIVRPPGIALTRTAEVV